MYSKNEIRIMTNKELRTGIKKSLWDRVLQLEYEKTAMISAIVSTVGGFVEGSPTTAINYLQRLRELVAVEKRYYQIGLPASILKDRAKTKREHAVKMRKRGYSFRQIAKVCGWKSPRTAFLAIRQRPIKL